MALTKSEMLHQLQRITRDSLFRNGIFLSGANFVPGVLGMVFWLFANRLYSTEDIGISSAIISAVTLIAGLAGPGFNLGIIRYLPESKNPLRFINTIYTSIVVFAFLFGCVFLIAIEWLPEFSKIRDNLFWVFYFLIFVIIVDLSGVVKGTFTARLRSDYVLKFSLVANVGRLAALFPAFKLGAQGILLSALSGYLIAILFIWNKISLIERNYKFSLSWDWSIIKHIFPFSFGNYIVALMNQLPQTIFPILIFSLMGATANGHAYIPLILSSAIQIPGFGLSMSAFAEGVNNPDKSRKILLKAVKLGSFITFVLVGFAFLFAPQILWLFGTINVSESVRLFRWLALASFPLVINQLYCAKLRIQKSTIRLIFFSGFITVFSLLVSYVLLITTHKITSIGIGVFLANGIAIFFIILDTFFKGDG